MNTPITTTTDDLREKLGLNTSDNGDRRQKRRWKWLIAGIFVLAGILAIIWKPKPAPVAYTTEPVRRGDLVATVSATGTLEPIKKVQVGIEVSGTIQTVEADYNSEVKVGQVLARLDTTKLESQAQQSQANLESAKAKLIQAEASVKETEAQMARLEKVKALSGGKVPSQYDLDTAFAASARARAEWANAKASISQAQAVLDMNQNELTKAIIRSPINGIVLKRSVEPGQTVAATFQAPELFTLAEDLSQMELQVDVDEADVGRVKAGQEATFTVDAYPDRKFPARITQVRFGSQTVDGVVTYKTILLVDNTAQLLRPGMTATAEIVVLRKTNVVLLPNTALRFAPPSTGSEPKRNSGLLSMLLPRPPAADSKPVENSESKKKEQNVWTLRNGQLAAIQVVKGDTDGTVTELLGGQVEVGTELVTETISNR